MMYLKIKRSFDILFSFIMILLLLPVLFVISVVIKFECPNCGIIFRQKRYGKNSEAFVIYKFRTVKKDAPNISACEMVINQDKYITKFGKFLRKTSLDELPQLFNILKGDMSIIGPRPVILAEEYLQNLKKAKRLRQYTSRVDGSCTGKRKKFFYQMMKKQNLTLSIIIKSVFGLM